MTVNLKTRSSFSLFSAMITPRICGKAFGNHSQQQGSEGGSSSRVGAHLVTFYVRLLRDNEAEVCIAVAGKMTNFCRILSPQVAIQNVHPCVKELSSDPSQHVRSALASVIMGMAPVLGKLLVEVFHKILKANWHRNERVWILPLSSLPKVEEVPGKVAGAFVEIVLEQMVFYKCIVALQRNHHLLKGSPPIQTCFSEKSANPKSTGMSSIDGTTDQKCEVLDWRRNIVAIGRVHTDSNQMTSHEIPFNKKKL